MSDKRITILILAVAAVAIVAVLSAGGGIDLPSFGGGDDDDPQEQVADTGEAEAPADAEADEAEEEPGSSCPRTPTRCAAATPTRSPVPPTCAARWPCSTSAASAWEGVFDGLRIAPGRIDTVIIHPDDRRTNIQIRPDMEISFESTHDFPTQQGFRRGGLSAREVPVTAVGRLLRAIDRERSGSATRDVDYVVVGRTH